jgi:multidrug efflux pump subunit AcrB
VDDAIVMLENIVRHMEMGEGRLEAALNGSRNQFHNFVDHTVTGGSIHPHAVYGRHSGTAVS